MRGGETPALGRISHVPEARRCVGVAANDFEVRLGAAPILAEALTFLPAHLLHHLARGGRHGVVFSECATRLTL